MRWTKVCFKLTARTKAELQLIIVLNFEKREKIKFYFANMTVDSKVLE